MNQLGGESLSFGWALVKTILVLVLLAPLIYYATRFYGSHTMGKGGNIQVVESLSLGGRRSLYVVKVGTKTLLLGVTDNSVEVLADLSQEELTPRQPAFADLVQEFWPRNRKRSNND